MDDAALQKMFKPDKYQVFLLTCPATLPFSFARHPWFVINRRGSISRWEVFWRSQRRKNRWGHLNKDFYSPAQGIPQLFFSEKHLWQNAKLEGSIEGDDGSLAEKMAEFIENSANIYPYCNRYAFKGPNSNTYVQWALDRFPDCGLRLPWNSFGRTFEKERL